MDKPAARYREEAPTPTTTRIMDTATGAVLYDGPTDSPELNEMRRVVMALVRSLST